MGAGARLRERWPDVVVAAAEPLPGDPVMGLRSLDDGYVPPILDVSKLDRKVLVSNEESVVGVRDLLASEGLFAGVSSGAVAHVARKLAAELDEGVVVCVLADARLEVPLRRRSGRRPTSSARWRRASGGDPAGDPRRARRARASGGAERSVRPDRPARRPRGALRPRPQHARVAVPLPARGRSRHVVPRGRGLRAGRLPLAPGDRAAAVAHRHRERRPVGRQAVRDLFARARRARGAGRSPAARSSRSSSA